MSSPSFACNQIKPKTGILLVQLGTPEDHTPEAVRKYLKEFLNDRRVVDVNRFVWWFVLNFIILRTRPAKSALLYERLFQNYGPVLLTYTQSLTTKMSQHFSENNFVVRYAMRYGKPTIKSVLKELAQKLHCERILVVPLYPQYSSATTGSVVEAVYREIADWRWIPSIRVMAPYHKDDLFLNVWAENMNQKILARKTPPQKIILSYHGIPQRYVDSGDPYACMCLDTTDGIKSRLKYPAADVIHSYQSRFGKEEWLKPYTDQTVESLAKEGIRDVMIASPSFTMDCLETLDELGVELKNHFEHHGGERLELVSCLNDAPLWVESLTRMIKTDLGEWS